MPNIYDNITNRVANAIQAAFLNSQHVDICVGYFTIQGWKLINSTVEKLNGGIGFQCRLLIGMPYKDELGGLLDETNREYLKIIIDHLERKKIDIRFPSFDLHAKLYLFYESHSDSPHTVILGSSNLTQSGLYTQGELNVDINDFESRNNLTKWFENRWRESDSRNITEILKKTIGTGDKTAFTNAFSDTNNDIESSFQKEVFVENVASDKSKESTPLPLGIQTLGGIMTRVVPANSPFPFSKSDIFSTAVDNQTAVEILVLQGEKPKAIDNQALGKFLLEGIAQAPKGIPQIEVTFQIDENGNLFVTARDKASNEQNSLRIKSLNPTFYNKKDASSTSPVPEPSISKGNKKEELIKESNSTQRAILLTILILSLIVIGIICIKPLPPPPSPPIIKIDTIMVRTSVSLENRFVQGIPTKSKDTIYRTDTFFIGSHPPQPKSIVYTIQVLATPRRAEAERMVAQLKKKGAAASISTIEQNNFTIFRVRVGKYESIDAANMEAEQLNIPHKSAWIAKITK